jgi:hypothetical protein
MSKYRFATTILLASIVAVPALADEGGDGNIVVSDGWCAPSGACNLCNSGHLIVSALCTGSYCDNMIYHCQNPPVVGGQNTSLSGLPAIVNEFTPPNYGWVSDEDGGSTTIARCPFPYAMVGMYSSNSYSDNIRTVCQLVTRPGGFSAIPGSGSHAVIQQNTSISEESPNNFMSVGSSGWLLGASCTGSFCDNMKYWFATFN